VVWGLGERGQGEGKQEKRQAGRPGVMDLRAGIDVGKEHGSHL